MKTRSIVFVTVDAEGVSWSSDSAQDVAEWADPQEPVFVLVREGRRRAAGVWTPQRACPTTAAALEHEAARLVATLEAAR